MSRSTKLIVTCAAALGALGAASAPAVAVGMAPSDRVQTISVLERNSTLLPGLDDNHGSVAPTATPAG
ncbi:hypothetical protein [Streptomyces reniochalinae]|uniref:Uncharacterized protein n=1 Tax=Streptomyces reniochalinae TaxID=2250578 RepID=A0A367EIN4_9ACTN|nr:hypothetical protein [Streptomyces reniochalinae]RCG17956.1 hypothetical protein DQ392_14775 [Streptomyces reniochalinae]